MPLSNKHKHFADIYLSDDKRDQTAAYKKVFGEELSNSVASANSSRLLRTVPVKEYINAIERKATEKVEADVTWVKQKLKRFSEAQITDFFTVKKGKLVLKDLKKLPPEMIDCIQAIRQTKDGIFLTLCDKKSSVTDLGKSIGMFEDPESSKITNITLIAHGVDAV